MTLFDVYSIYPVTPVRGNDVFIYDNIGTKYLDLYGGHAVISIGHSHPHYVKSVQEQVGTLGFYSNAVINPLQEKLAKKLATVSGCEQYQLFLCNSGAEANENALKLASFTTEKSRVIAFKNGFHGRTSAAVSVTDNSSIQAPLNKQNPVSFLELGDLNSLETELSKGGVCAIILECIQGIGGLEEAEHEFYTTLDHLCAKYKCLLIADEVQSGFGRTGDFFAFQKYNMHPHIISMAKGMGNGFPVGGVFIHQDIPSKKGMLGTTFGGNHLACAATLSVLETIEKEQLMNNVKKLESVFAEKAKKLKAIKAVKGRGLMLGLEFDFEVAELRKKLLFDHHIFTGSSNNKRLLRILPPLCVKETHIDHFFNELDKALS